MSRRLGACAVLLAFAAALSRAQPGPGPGPGPGRGPGRRAGFPAEASVVDLDQLANEVRTRPSDARSVHPRYRMLMELLQRRRVPPPPELRERLEKIRTMLGQGSFTKAAGVLDMTVQDLARAPQPPRLNDPPPGVPAPAAPAAAPAAPAAEAAMASETPRLLSTPAPAPVPAAVTPDNMGKPLFAPAARSALDVTRGAAAAESADRAAAAGRSGPPFSPLLLMGFILGASALVYGFASTRLRPKAATTGAGPAIPKLAKHEPEKTLTDKYELGRAIAAGGMGEVFEGKDRTLGRRVAIKKMLADIQLDPGLRAQFLKEAKTVAKLSHPYIVPIHEALESGGELYLVFEYVEGEPLSSRLTREARLPLKECKKILGYVAKAIEYAHGRHVLHRDIKPANIMLGKDGIARVMDFGIALESTRTATSTSPAFLDASGTLRYMPPEQHYGASTRASDVYAMGVCLYEMATGNPPFAAGTVDQLIELKRAAKFPKPSTIIPGLPTELDLLATASLAPDPAKRISTAAEFLDLLEGLPT